MLTPDLLSGVLALLGILIIALVIWGVASEARPPEFPDWDDDVTAALAAPEDLEGENNRRWRELYLQ